ncbi:MAG: guanylate kinase [Alphaproteobacteria bacterium]|nr:guanylate kinase [Alphaproteobacteria bacterium]
MGHLFVISGPSAVGKTSVVRYLLDKNPQLSRVITCTTRAVRDNEQDGVDYIFLSKEDFREKIENNEFAEFSEVYENYYGVLLASIQESMRKNDISILVINWEGFQKVRRFITENITGIFLNPPSIEELEKRLRGRNTENEGDIQKRLLTARLDIAHSCEYDFSVENKEIPQAAEDIFSIISKVVSGRSEQLDGGQEAKETLKAQEMQKVSRVVVG